MELTFAFDLGKVGVDYDDHLYIDNLNGYVRGLPIPYSCLNGAMGSLMAAYNAGQLDTEEFRQAVVRTYFTKRDRIPNPGEFYAAYAKVLKLMPETVAIWRELRQRGYQLIAFSNIDPMRHRECRTLGVFEHFHKSVLSYEHQMRKPAPELVDVLIRTAGVPPERIYYPDDVEANLVPARKRGLITHHFVCANGLRKDLRHHGIMLS